MTRRILTVFSMIFILGSVYSLSAWADPSLVTANRENRHDKLPQIKTQWQKIAEADISSENARWEMINEQFQPGKPPKEYR